uniref:Uncharacterized protein n=1 Tax=Rhodnius prolixus TaxID=13249 RepID=T1I1X1_RHOPR
MEKHCLKLDELDIALEFLKIVFSVLDVMDDFFMNVIWRHCEGLEFHSKFTDGKPTIQTQCT